MKPLSQGTMRILASIANHQRDIKRLTRQIMDRYNLNEVVDEDCWDWAMYVDRQGAVTPQKDAAGLLQDFLALKTARLLQDFLAPKEGTNK